MTVLAPAKPQRFKKFNAFGKYLYNLGMSQNELSRRLGHHPATIKRWCESKTLNVETTLIIEKITDGAIKPSDLRPDLAEIFTR
jgi:DNA-binding transcriptional regulator YdaS (Cro superfamily)